MCMCVRTCMLCVLYYRGECTCWSVQGDDESESQVGRSPCTAVQ